MGTTIATKSDLALLATKAEVVDVRQDLALLRKDVETLATTITVRLGSLLLIGLGVLFAALKLT